MVDRFGLLSPVTRANIEREEVVDRELGRAQAVSKALRQYDERLSLVWVKDNAPADRSLVPGRWHVHRRNDPPAPDSYMPITGPSGEYREPHHGILNELAERDLWRRADPVPEKAPEAKDPDHLDEMKSDFQAAKRVAGENVYRKSWGRGRPKGVRQWS